MRNCKLYLSKYYSQKKLLKTCQEQPHLVSARFAGWDKMHSQSESCTGRARNFVNSAR